ncbi:MAG: LysR family transcriptional regulator [Desulfobacteraceae bacterium]|jgi:LysR family transcriptional regulator for metE and metH
MIDIEIKHLRMIQAIAGTKNLTKAAEKLFISQSALSQQLINIEDKIGANLFFRNGKNMTLTKVGQKLLDSARVILEEIERATREVAKQANGEKGELKIGVRCIFCFKWIPVVVKQFQEKYPNVDIEINHSQLPERELLSKKFDVTISSATIINPRISRSELFKMEFLCVMSGDHPLSRKIYLELEDLEGMDMISMSDKSNSSFFNMYIKDSNIQLRRFMTVPYPEVIVDLVDAGFGIAILPEWFVYPFTLTKNIHTCHFTTKKNIRQLKAHYLADKDIPAYQNEFLDTIVSYAINNQMDLRKSRLPT